MVLCHCIIQNSSTFTIPLRAAGAEDDLFFWTCLKLNSKQKLTEPLLFLQLLSCGSTWKVSSASGDLHIITEDLD